MNVVSAEDLGLRLSGFGYRLTRKCGSMGELGTPIGDAQNLVQGLLTVPRACSPSTVSMGRLNSIHAPSTP